MAKKHKVDDLIEPILLVDSQSQDDDLWLQCRIIANETGVDVHKLYAFLKPLPNLETIRRRRQIIQAKCNQKIEARLALGESISDIIDIRGKQYNKRHKIAAKVRADYSPTFEERVDRDTPRYQQ